MPESPIRTHLRLVRAGQGASSDWGRTRKAVPEEAIVPIGRTDPTAKGASIAAGEGGGESGIRKHLRLLTGGLRHGAWGRSRLSVPPESIVLVGRTGPRRGLTRKHILMLALAAEVLCLGFLFARDHSKGVLVDEPEYVGNIVT